MRPENVRVNNMSPYLLISIAFIVLSCVLSFSFYPLFPTLDDPRVTKDFLSVMFALAITGVCILGKPRRFKVYPLLSLLILYCVLRCFLGPAFRFPVVNTQEDNIWQYRVVMYDLIFFSFFVAVSNLSWGILKLRKFFTVISWVGGLTAAYVFVQALGFDQWLILKTTAEVQNTPSAGLTGTMTNVTFAAAFLVLTIPIMIARRYWWAVVLAIGAVILCKSDMAYGALALSLLGYAAFKIKWTGRRKAIAFLLVLLTALWISDHKIHVQDNGRFYIWKQIWTDVTVSPFEENTNYFLTGYGLGAYKYLFTAQHTTQYINETTMQRAFEQAHNDPLEWFYNTGIIGFGLLIFIVFCLIKAVFPYTLTDERYLALLITFISGLMLSCGTFLLQIEPQRFLMVVVAAILYNRIIKEEKQRWEK